jgi:O-antigen/teichoic acid export membrane protein
MLISIIFAKIPLGTGEIGVYEAFLLIAGGVSFFWTNGLIQSLLTLFNSNKSFKNQIGEETPVIFNAALVAILFSAIAAGAVLIFNKNIAVLTNLHTGTIPYLKILVAYIFFSGPNNLIEYILLLTKQSKKIIVYGLIAFSLQLIFLCTPLILGYDLGYGLYGLLAVNMLKFLYLLVLINKHSRFHISLKFIREHLYYGFPLIVSILLSGSAAYFDGFLVANKFNEAQLAIFRYGAKELPFVVLLANAFDSAMVPELSGKKLNRVDLHLLRKKTVRFIHILFPISIFLIMISKWIYPIVFNPNFEDSALVFNIYILVIISRLIFPQTILIAQKKTKIVMFSSMIELFINVSLSIWFISFWGIEGVALATLVAYLSQKLIMMAYLSGKMHVKTSDYIPVKSWLIWSIIISAVYLIVRFVV